MKTLISLIKRFPVDIILWVITIIAFILVLNNHLEYGRIIVLFILYIPGVIYRIYYLVRILEDPEKYKEFRRMNKLD